MGRTLHNVMSQKEEKAPKPKKRHRDALRNIQFVPQRHERVDVRKIVSLSKKLRIKEEEKTITDVAEESILLTFSRGENVVNMLQPSKYYQTKGEKKLNVWLEPEVYNRIEQLSIIHDTSIKHIAYTLFSFSLNSVLIAAEHKLKEAEKNGTTLTVGTHTARNGVSYETESAGVLL